MTTDTTTHTPSESCLCDACPWAKREQAKQAAASTSQTMRYAIVADITQTSSPRATVVECFATFREAVQAWEKLGRWFDHALVRDDRGFDQGERVWMRAVEKVRIHERRG